MKGDFVLEKDTSRPAKSTDLQMNSESQAEPYVGMPIYLDDSFFKFMGDDIGVECPIEDDMDEYLDDNMLDMMPKNGETKPENGDKMPINGDIERPMYEVESGALAMAYVPWQIWDQTYDIEEGFRAGTIFPELDLPFLGGAKNE